MCSVWCVAWLEGVGSGWDNLVCALFFVLLFWVGLPDVGRAAPWTFSILCCFNCLFPEQSLSWSALCTYVSWPYYLHPFSGWGSLMCTHSHIILAVQPDALALVPHSLCMGQSWMWVSHFATSALLLSWAAPYACTVVLYFFCSSHGWGSLVDRYHNIFLTLHWLQVREMHVHVQPSRCMKHHPAIPARSISGCMGPVEPTMVASCLHYI